MRVRWKSLGGVVFALAVAPVAVAVPLDYSVVVRQGQLIDGQPAAWGTVRINSRHEVAFLDVPSGTIMTPERVLVRDGDWVWGTDGQSAARASIIDPRIGWSATGQVLWAGTADHNSGAWYLDHQAVASGTYQLPPITSFGDVTLVMPRGGMALSDNGQHAVFVAEYDVPGDSQTGGHLGVFTPDGPVVLEGQSFGTVTVDHLAFTGLGPVADDGTVVVYAFDAGSGDGVLLKVGPAGARVIARHNTTVDGVNLGLSYNDFYVSRNGQYVAFSSGTNDGAIFVDDGTGLRAVVRAGAGTEIGGVPINFIGAVFGVSDTGEVVFSAGSDVQDLTTWGLFTQNRAIALNGDTVSGVPISSIGASASDGTIAMSADGVVVFDAILSPPNAQGYHALLVSSRDVPTALNVAVPEPGSLPLLVTCVVVTVLGAARRGARRRRRALAS